jgi:SAM-dependent methyltransferase
MDFDKAAPEWDAVPMRSERAGIAAEGIRGRLGGIKRARAFEFGCGTGLLSFFLKDDFDEIVLLDSSAGMIEALRRKIEDFGVGNMLPILGAIEDSAGIVGKADIAYSLMALHHAEELDSTLKSLYSILNSGGLLCIVDLDKDDGSFHKDEMDFRGHHGFDQRELGDRLRGLGFGDIRSAIIYQNARIVDGVERFYPLFLMSAVK